MIVCERDTCTSMDCRDARSMASLVIPSTEDFVTNIRHLKCKVIQLARRQMQKEVPRWSDRMVNRGVEKIVRGEGKTISGPKKQQIPTENIAAFAVEGPQVQDLQRIPEREKKEEIKSPRTSLNNETTTFNPESDRSHQPYDWNTETDQNGQTHNWHSETNQNDRTRETNRNDRTNDWNPGTDQNNRTDDWNGHRNGNVTRASTEMPSNSILNWTKKILTSSFPIYWIILVVGILGIASLVCGVLIGAVLCANGDPSFPFFLRVKSRSGQAAY